MLLGMNMKTSQKQSLTKDFLPFRACVFVICFSVCFLGKKSNNLIDMFSQVQSRNGKIVA